MNKKEIISAIATELNEAQGEDSKKSFTNDQVEQTINALFNLIKSEVKNGEKVQFIGFGNFEPKVNAARTGINPQTKEKIQIKQSNSVKFKVGKAFKDYLNE